MSANETAVAADTVRREVCASASGRRDDATIHTIAPAAKPSAAGKTAEKRSTNRYAGTARRGWGRLEKMLQPAAARTSRPGESGPG